MRRFLHYVPEAPELAGHNVVRVAPVVDPRVPQAPAFRVLGLGSLLQVQLPPSIALVARRNALSGVLGSVGALTARLRVARAPLRRLLARQPVLEQRIVGTQPLVCLLGVTSAAARHLSAIELDGSRDWVVVRPSQIHAYCGTQLSLAPRSGWRPGGPPFAHTLVSGRGWLSLASPLSVVQFHVPAGESVLVQKRNLNAYTADTNAAPRPPAVTHVGFEFARTRANEPVVAAPPPRAASRAATVWAATRAESARLARVAAGWLRRVLNAGNTAPFVEIHGPSTVIISGAAPPLSSRLARAAEEPAATGPAGPAAAAPAEPAAAAPAKKPVGVAPGAPVAGAA